MFLSNTVDVLDERLHLGSALGGTILLTAVYATGLIFRPPRNHARMGLDSIAVLVLYGAGLAGLIALAQS